MLDIPVRVKDALRDGRLLKEYEILILDDEGAIEDTIDNNNLVYESVHINEKLCSGDVLKFGLCEGSSIEFEYFDRPDILGRRIHVLLHVQYKNIQDELAWYHHISMGFFTVEKCPRQFSTGIYKATAYSKLQSKYLDEKANETLYYTYEDLHHDSFITKVTMDLLLSRALEGYAIESDESFNLVYDRTSLAQPYNKEWVYWSEELKWWSFYISSTIQFTLPSSASFPWGYGRVRIIGLHDLWQRLTQTISGINQYPRKILITSSTVNNYEITFSSSTENDITTDVIENVSTVTITVPGSYAQSFNEMVETPSALQLQAAARAVDEIINDMVTNKELEVIFIHTVSGGLGDVEVTADIENWGDVTLRDLQSAVFESLCQFGQLDRQTDLFKGIELNNSALFPADTLYPAGDLCPSGILERTVKSGYSKLWSESGNVQSWRNLIITYKGRENNQEVEKTLTRTINANGTTDYNMSDNWLFKNLVWSDSDIGDYADAMVLKMQDVTWFPFEMWGAGLPYLETGDQIEVVDMAGETHPSYVLSRQLDGIQNLQDTLLNGTLDIF